MPPVPIHQVLEDGRVRHLGDWLAEDQRLELHEPGFPLLGPGRHQIEDELPWVFWDMCPSGFLGRRFAQTEPALGLNADPRTWTVPEVLRVLTEAGEDLPGNLIVGVHSLERWERRREREERYHAQLTAFLRGEVDEGPGLRREGDTVTVGRREWDVDIDAWLADPSSGAPSSSLGGERPKLSLTKRGGGELLKFSPPLGTRETPQARRWADLLRVEAHCAATLRQFGVPAVVSLVASREERVVLVINRFDRTPRWGRRGATTLYWYAMSRYGDVRVAAPRVIADLVTDGHLEASAAQLVADVHAFSAAIGNNDTHLGNYGLTFDESGRASLAPFYDILPMALAPMNDELPDHRLRPRVEPVPPSVAPWVDRLLAVATADREISREFIALWARHLGV